MNSEELQKKLSKLAESEGGGFAKMLGLKFLEVDPRLVSAELEVNAELHQPFGIMHGGVSLVLAESVASIGAWLNVPDGHKIVGLEINANHLKSIVNAKLFAAATPVHVGRSSQVWSVEIKNGSELVCIARCTLLNLEPKS
jgi:1,4-dihydroxy-2-naphthoyl-CoA hydrolase